jgi:hypothetical protein
MRLKPRNLENGLYFLIPTHLTAMDPVVSTRKFDSGAHPVSRNDLISIADLSLATNERWREVLPSVSRTHEEAMCCRNSLGRWLPMLRRYEISQSRGSNPVTTMPWNCAWPPDHQRKLEALRAGAPLGFSYNKLWLPSLSRRQSRLVELASSRVCGFY